MDIWQASLLVGAIATAIFSMRSPRGLAWIAAFMASFFISGAYWDAGWPLPALFGIACDVAVWSLIYQWGNYRWEVGRFGLLGVILAMIVVNLSWLVIKALGWPSSHELFAAALEGLNWLALLVIGGGVAAEVIETRGAENGMARGSSRNRGLRGHLLALRAPRRSPPFWRVP